MKLPSYEAAFNKESEIKELSDVSFESNAKSLLEGHYKFLPSLEEHLANLDNLEPEEISAYNNSIAQILYGPRILELFKEKRYKEITDLLETIKESS